MEDEHMIEFLVAYKVFARGTTIHGLEHGLHNPYRFSTGGGLCVALGNFVDIEVGLIDSDDYMALYGRMMYQLKCAIANLVGGMNPTYPFGGESTYGAEARARTQHENPLRLKFVDEYLSELYTDIGLPPAPKMEKV